MQSKLIAYKAYGLRKVYHLHTKNRNCEHNPRKSRP